MITSKRHRTTAMAGSRRQQPPSGTIFPASSDINDGHRHHLHSGEDHRSREKPSKLERGILTVSGKTSVAMTSIRGCWHKFSNRLRDYIESVDLHYRPNEDVTDSSSKFAQDPTAITSNQHLQDENMINFAICKSNRHRSHKPTSRIHKQYDQNGSSRVYNCGGIIGVGRSGSGDESHRSSSSKHHNGESRTRPRLPPGFSKCKTTDGQIFFMDIDGNKHWFDPTVPKELIAASLDLNLDLIVGRLSSNWEIRHTPSGKTYYVDHVKKSTQFTDPRLVAYKDELMKYLLRTNYASLKSNKTDQSAIVLSPRHRSQATSNHHASSTNHHDNFQGESCPNYTKRGHDSAHGSRSQPVAEPGSSSQLQQVIHKNTSTNPTTLLSARQQNINLMRGSLHNLSTATQAIDISDVTGGTLNRNSIAQLKHYRQGQQLMRQNAIPESATLNPSRTGNSSGIQQNHHYEQISQTLPRNSGSVANLTTNSNNKTSNGHNNDNSATANLVLNTSGISRAQNDTSMDQRHNHQENSFCHQHQSRNNKVLCDKISILRQELIKQQVLTHPCRIDIKRKQLFDDSFRVLSQMTSRDLKKRLLVKFRGEEGLDYGGVAREWFYLLSRKMLNPMCGLFQYTSDDIYNLQINPDSSIVYREHLQYFRFCGRILGMAAFHGHFIEGHFTKPFYKMLLGRPIKLEDIENVDPELHRSLCWILENDITNVIDTTFLVQHNTLGQLQEYELKDNGRNISVTEENKHEYVNLYVNYRCRRGIEYQTEALQRGFNELISPSLVENFNEHELELLIGGLSRIDIEDWRLHTKLKNCTVESPLVRWFWDLVKSYNEDRRARLLQFVTGSSRVPIQGFKALQGVNSESRLFTIHLIKNACTDNLPKSHTCFNRIDLPPYESYEKLRDKLTQAIEETMGFAMQ